MCWLVSVSFDDMSQIKCYTKDIKPSEAAQANVDRKRFFANEMRKMGGEIH